MVNIVIQGIYGRMGQVLTEMIAQRNDCTLVAGVDTAAGPDLGVPVVNNIDDLASLDIKPDVLIDFSHPDAVRKALVFCEENNLPCVICTTGLGEDIQQMMQKTCAKTAVFYSANMSLGINLLAQLVKKAVATLQGFDVEIVEKHHHNKLDAPSGTAIMLADAANEQAGGRFEYVYDRSSVRQKRGENELGISAIRGGSIVGEHDVIFAGPDEVITLSHSAYSRNVFANGAVAAAVYLCGRKPGMYNMNNLLEEIK